MTIESVIVDIHRKGLRVSILGETDNGSSWQCGLHFRGKDAPATWFRGEGDNALAALQSAFSKFGQTPARMPVKRHKFEDMF